MHPPSSYLFVPANRPERFAKAFAAGADAVILDLEDAVLAAEKEAARANARAWLSTAGEPASRAVIRINDVGTDWFAADCEFVRSSKVQHVMLPKTESPAHVAAVLTALPAGGSVLPLIETAVGVQEVAAIARAPGVQRLVFGTLEYALDLDLSDDPRGLLYPAAQIAIASRAAGIAAPVAGVTPALHDDAQFRADWAFARALGFTAKLCIHPRQVVLLRELLQPTPAEIEWARRVIAAAEASSGAVQLDGKMIDQPVLRRARALLGRLQP